MLTFQVCRVLKAYYHSSKESTRAANVVSPEFRIEEALGSCLFPSLQLIPANPAVDMEIWGVLSLLPYEVCHSILFLLLYSCFSHLVSWLSLVSRHATVYTVNGRRRPNKTQLSLLQGKLQRSYFYLSNVFSNLSLNVKFIHNHPSFLLNQLDTRRLLKRLAKENLKPLGRMVAKLAHANPMTVLRTIVQQVRAT